MSELNKHTIGIIVLFLSSFVSPSYGQAALNGSNCLLLSSPAPVDSALAGTRYPRITELCVTQSALAVADQGQFAVFNRVAQGVGGTNNIYMRPSQVTTNQYTDPYYGESKINFSLVVYTVDKNGNIEYIDAQTTFRATVVRNSGSHDDSKKTVIRPRGLLRVRNADGTLVPAGGEILPPGVAAPITYEKHVTGGEFSFNYTASEFASDVNIDITFRTADGFNGGFSFPVKVGVIGLEGRQRYNTTNGGYWEVKNAFVGNDVSHFGYNYYARHDTLSRLNNAAEIFTALGQPSPQVPTSKPAPLIVTALSLPSGGKFDDRGNFNRPHTNHRNGENADVRTNGLTAIEKFNLTVAMEEAGFIFNVVTPPESPNNCTYIGGQDIGLSCPGSLTHFHATVEATQASSISGSDFDE